MNKELKNKFDNYEVRPPDYILENLKKDLGFAKQSFLVRHKYSIAASLVGAVIALFIIAKNQNNDNNISNNDIKNKTEIQKQKPVKNTINTEKKKLVKDEINKPTNNNSTENKTIKENNSDNKENKIVKINKALISQLNIKKINAGNDMSVCGSECQLGENSNAKTGNWLANNNLSFADINNPKTTVISNSFGKQMLIWSEKTNDGFILDTIIIEFKEIPDNLQITQVNEHCGRADAMVEFITKDGNYTFKWSDNTVTSSPIRKNLSTGNYSVIVNHNACSSSYDVEITNTEEVNVDFYHTELYSAINSPIYFTDRTKLTSIDKNELSYKWSFGDGTSSNKINPEHKYTKAGEYEVTLKVSTKNGCADTFKSTISINEEDNVLPNIFTPNGDGVHDVLIINPKPLKNFKALIFNKAGQQVYEWNNQYEGWDGNLKNGEQAAEGVYYYVVTGIDSDGKKSQYRSFIHLTR